MLLGILPLESIDPGYMVGLQSCGTGLVKDGILEVYDAVGNQNIYLRKMK